MADELTRCPACDHTLRLPAEFLGRSVECPKCGHRFRAEGAAGAPAGGFDSPPDAAVAHSGPRRPDGLTAPAIALLITSILTALANLGGTPSLILANQDPAAFDKQIRQQIEAKQQPNMAPEEKEMMDKMSQMMSADNFKSWGNPYCGLSWLTGLMTLGGAIAMLTRKAYGLAIVGCLAAFFPSPCCLVQAPFGLWGLIVLLGSGKAAFR